MKQFQVEEERKLQQERLIQAARDEAEKQRELERERVRRRAYSSPAPSRSRDYGMSR